MEIYEDKAVIQVFEGTDNMSLKNTHTTTDRTSDGALPYHWTSSAVPSMVLDSPSMVWVISSGAV